MSQKKKLLDNFIKFAKSYFQMQEYRIVSLLSTNVSKMLARGKEGKYFHYKKIMSVLKNSSEKM